MVRLTKGNYTQQQIDAAEPLIRQEIQYQQKIGMIRRDGLPTGDFDAALAQKKKLLNLEDKRREVSEKIEIVLNARDIYEHRFKEIEKEIADLEEFKNKWGL